MHRRDEDVLKEVTINQHLEEDFRFATKPQVQSYSSEDLKRFPHIDGFNLTQLLDQIDGQVLSSQKESRGFQALIEATGGTALCLAQHLSSHENLEIEIYLTDYYDSALLVQLRKVPNVKTVSTSYLGQVPDGRYVIIADKVPRSSPLALDLGNARGFICYDPDRKLDDPAGGKYFMNSNVWVRRGN